MAEVAETITAPAPVVEVPSTPPQSPMIYTGTSNNLVPGAALFFAGVLAFTMNMTNVFFAEAIAWTFAAWGLLMIYTGLLVMYETYEVTDDALIIRNIMRPWQPKKTFDWARVTRLDVVVERTEAREEDVTLHVYYQPEGEIAQERRDRLYNPNLAAAIVERAVLNPADKNTPRDVTRIPRENKATYTWK